MRDPIYRLLRSHLQALLDRDAPRATVLIEVDWAPGDHPDEGKVCCIAREDDTGMYVVWTVGFVETRPDSLNHGRYGILDLATAAAEVHARIAGQTPIRTPDNRALVNQAIGCVGVLHSMIYNPDDMRPAEPKLAELEKLLRDVRF